MHDSMCVCCGGMALAHVQQAYEVSVSQSIYVLSVTRYLRHAPCFETTATLQCMA
jgi:hypothetical protein